MGELAVAKAPDTLEIRGLGSCIALAIHDPLQRLAGLAHIVIPRPLPSAPPEPAWAATTAVPALLDAVQMQGGRTGRLVARIAGGATMFPGIRKGYDVGRENADVVEALLQAYRIPILSRQVGGRASRSVFLHAEDGRFDVRTTAFTPQASRPAGVDPIESVRTLLESVAAPLSDILQRPIAVDAAGRYDLAPAEAVAFLGAGARLRWGRLAYASRDGRATLHAALPEDHARRLDEELRGRLPDAGEEGAAIDEALNIMLSHGLTALSRLRGETLRPEALLLGEGTARELVASLSKGPAAPVRVAHARLHLEGAFHGAEMALVGDHVP
jgi:chemotaxis protein CheD